MAAPLYAEASTTGPYTQKLQLNSIFANQVPLYLQYSTFRNEIELFLFIARLSACKCVGCSDDDSALAVYVLFLGLQLRHVPG